MFIEIHVSNFADVIVIAASAFLVLGHNLWLVAKDETNDLKLEILTSDKFPESDSAIKPERIVDFRAFTETDSLAINDYRAEENSLIARVRKAKKIICVALELRPHPIVLDAGKFAGYIKSEAAENAVAAQFVVGETAAAQRESYAKFAKVLIDNRAFARTIGQKFEIVLESNPADIKTSGKLKVKVLFDDQPMENLRVSAGAENLNGGRYSAHARTDANGAAELEISGGGLWFVRTHYIRPHTDSNNFDWESFWASLTFRV